MFVIVEADEEHLKVRTEGRNRDYKWAQIPTKLAYYLAEQGLGTADPVHYMVLASFEIVEPKGDLQQARSLLEYAQRANLNTRPLIEELNAARAENVLNASRWSSLISASTIEDEVKAQTSPLAKATKTPIAFKGGGNHPARMHFTELAMLFGIIDQYDGEVRWKKDAGGLREIFRRAGVNCKVVTDNSFKAAHQRSDDLAQLISGAKIELPIAVPDAKWAEIANRPPLMTRMGREGYSARIQVWTSDTREFSKNRNALLREAQIVAAIARVIQDPSYEFADDDTYLGYAQDLETQALQIVEAVKDDSRVSAQSAAGQVNKACTACHVNYRNGG
jgi:hypothetical protein